MLHAEQYNKIRDELVQSRDSIAHDINAKLPDNAWMDPDINTKVVPLGLKKLKQQLFILLPLLSVKAIHPLRLLCLREDVLVHMPPAKERWVRRSHS